MKQIKLTATGVALGLAAMAVPASAQDRDNHFNGPYIQVFGGVATQSNDGGSTLAFDTNQDGAYDENVLTAAGADAFSPGFCNGLARGATRASGCRKDKSGVEYGGRIGYDRRMNNFVVGGLIEATGNDAADATSGFSTTPASYSIEREVDYTVSARLRAGYTPRGGMLFYVTGGGGIAKLQHSFVTTNTANTFTPNRDGKAIWGWQAGAGGEIMVTDKVSLGLEYLYNRYDDDKYNVSVGRGGAPATNPFVVRAGGTNLQSADRQFDFHSMRAVLGYRF